MQIFRDIRLLFWIGFALLLGSITFIALATEKPPTAEVLELSAVEEVELLAGWRRTIAQGYTAETQDQVSLWHESLDTVIIRYSDTSSSVINSMFLRADVVKSIEGIDSVDLTRWLASDADDTVLRVKNIPVEQRPLPEVVSAEDLPPSTTSLPKTLDPGPPATLPRRDPMPPQSLQDRLDSFSS